MNRVAMVGAHAIPVGKSVHLLGRDDAVVCFLLSTESRARHVPV